MVFGGAARDKYLHDAHATSFFEANKSVTDSKVLDEYYQNRQYMPELSGRFVVPSDIDAFVHCTSQINVLAAIRKDFASCTLKFKRELKGYFPDVNVDVGDVYHYRYTITTMETSKIIRNWFLRELKIVCESSYIDGLFRQVYSPVILDLLVYNRDISTTMPDPPFGKVDFACNALILDKTGFRLSTQIKTVDAYARSRLLNNTFKDIEKRIARVNHIRWYRVYKMRTKGWTVIDLFHNIVEVQEHYPGHCIVCHGNVCAPYTDVIDQPISPSPISPISSRSSQAPMPNQESYLTDEDSHTESTHISSIVHMKQKCCDARYHPECLLRAYTLGENCMIHRQSCIMCSSPLQFTQQDAEKLTGYIRELM